MAAAQRETGIHLKILPRSQPSPLSLDVQSFLLDAQASNLSPGTLTFYRSKLQAFLDFLRDQGISVASDIQAAHIRQALVHLAEAGHTPGGVHAHWRAVRAFLNWCTREGIITRNPSDQVRPPRLPQEVLEPVNLKDLGKMLATCKKGVVGLRDKALLLTLLDSGLRAGELLALNVGDVDLQTGSVLVRKSKSRRPRTTFIGIKARRAVIAYLRARGNAGDDAPLWLAYRSTGERGQLTFGGLRDLVRRRAKAAGVPAPTLHSFRRAFALTMLRSGCDMVSLSRMMGHGSLPVLMRYLKQEVADLGRVHELYSPVDRLKL